jgi:hypothetical protein
MVVKWWREKWLRVGCGRKCHVGERKEGKKRN